MSTSQKTKTNSEWAEMLIKYISKNTANCTAPEAFIKWRAKFKEEHVECTLGVCSLYNYAREQLQKIEDVEYLSTLEKVQILFVLSQPISPKFKEILLQNGSSVELDKAKRILHFRSSDGTFERSGVQSPPGAPADDDQDGDGSGPSTSTNKAPVRQQSPIQEDHVRDRVIKEEQIDEAERESEQEGEIRRLGWDQEIKEEERDEAAQEELQFERQEEDERQREAEEERVQDRHQEQTVAAEAAPNPKRRQDSMPTEAKRSKPNEVPISSLAIPRASGSSNHDQDQTGVQTSTRQESHLSGHRSSGTFSTSPSRDVSVVIPRAGSDAPTPLPSINTASTSSASRVESINVGRLAEQLETVAGAFGLTDLEQKAVQLQKNVECQKKVSLNAFTYFVIGILRCSKDENAQDHQGDSIKTLTFFKRFRNFLIRPLGDESMGRIVEYLDRNIEKLNDKDDQSALPKEKVHSYLESLLDLVAKN